MLLRLLARARTTNIVEQDQLPRNILPGPSSAFALLQDITLLLFCKLLSLHAVYYLVQLPRPARQLLELSSTGGLLYLVRLCSMLFKFFLRFTIL